MKNSNTLLVLGLLIALGSSTISCNGNRKHNNQRPTKNPTQITKTVGGGCDGCEIMYVGLPNNVNAVDTSAGWTEKGQKLIVSGTAYQLDGKTPAPNVLIYYWQTDHNGYYSPTPELDEKAKQHGHIRGWVNTDPNGKYTLYTIRPAPYPNDVLPAHIHFLIKEPNIQNEYYINDIFFEDDKLVADYLKKYPPRNRGGSGLVKVAVKNNIQYVAHTIILGLNIPDYPN